MVDMVLQAPLDSIIWVHNDQLKGRVTFTDNLEGIEDLPRDQRHLLIVDNMMEEAGDKMLKLFTKGSHHRNMSIVYIVQNLLHKGKLHRSLNTHYLVFTQFQTLARQMFPG